MVRSLVRLSSIVGLVFATAAMPRNAAAQDNGLQKLTLDRYLDMESVSNPQISPDGAQIIYTRGWIDRVNDRRKSALWIMNVDGSKNRRLLEGGGVRWSPDGTRILFTSGADSSGSQIFVRWMDAEGAVSQITRLENGPSNPRWSPDGNWIAFTSRVNHKAEFAGVQLPSRPEGAKTVKRILSRSLVFPVIYQNLCTQPTKGEHNGPSNPPASPSN